mmetsp:Transcript_46078/g.149695  ORF Transcript_46078/g.149695 Transcript_46078/m.149695 type:complete len:234 (+) Transcript_46078:188-889(+)
MLLRAGLSLMLASSPPPPLGLAAELLFSASDSLVAAAAVLGRVSRRVASCERRLELLSDLLHAQLKVDGQVEATHQVCAGWVAPKVVPLGGRLQQRLELSLQRDGRRVGRVQRRWRAGERAEEVGRPLEVGARLRPDAVGEEVERPSRVGERSGAKRPKGASACKDEHLGADPRKRIPLGPSRHRALQLRDEPRSDPLRAEPVRRLSRGIGVSKAEDDPCRARLVARHEGRVQ